VKRHDNNNIFCFDNSRSAQLISMQTRREQSVARTSLFSRKRRRMRVDRPLSKISWNLFSMYFVVMPFQFKFCAKTFLTKEAFINSNAATKTFFGILCLASECLQEFHRILRTKYHAIN